MRDVGAPPTRLFAWSITDRGVMKATRRMVPWHVGHERVDFEDLLQQCRPAAGSLGRRQSWRGHDMGGASATTGSAWRRMPRGRLAYQP